MFVSCQKFPLIIFLNLRYAASRIPNAIHPKPRSRYQICLLGIHDLDGIRVYHPEYISDIRLCDIGQFLELLVHSIERISLNPACRRHRATMLHIILEKCFPTFSITCFRLVRISVTSLSIFRATATSIRISRVSTLLLAKQTIFR